jgi:hypothetical protein
MAHSKEADRSYDTEKIEKWKSLDKYDYDKHFPEEEKRPQQKVAIPSFFGVLGNLFIYLIVIGMIGLILYLIFLFVQQGKVRGRRVELKEDLQYTIEEELENSIDLDFDLQIKEALAQHNYRLAIRLHYLKALKALDEKDLIQWEKEKTNHDYFLELSTGPYGSTFSSILYIFNNIWYGYQSVEDEARYHELAQPIIHFQNTIRS